MLTGTIKYTITFLLGLLQYMGAGIAIPGTDAIPPPYDAQYDLNEDGFIGVQDLMICLANM
jgi:hypothetical protein